MGWVIIYGCKEVRQFYRQRMRAIFNVILMPTTIMQVALPGILFNENNNTRMKDRIAAMGVNQQALQKGLEG